MAVIEATGLSKKFSRRGGAAVEAVRDITFSVEPGERLAYIGPNGAGKSTSIKMLTGILYPSSGDAKVLGLRPWKQRRELSRQIGTLFGQRSQLWFQLAPRQTYALLARIYGLTRQQEQKRIAELGELLEANDLYDVPVRNMSLGQRMRCELVASLLHGPQILFLDEPTIGLDLVAKANFRSLILQLNAQQKTTIFLTSHDVSDIEQVARRVIVINHGTLIYDDSVSRMRRRLLSTKIIRVRFETPVDAIETTGAEVLTLSDQGAKLAVDTKHHAIRDVLEALIDRYPIVDISVTDPPLEDVVTHIYTAPR
jgi:viologen exporter family transport system ATP-binding protein